MIQDKQQTFLKTSGDFPGQDRREMTVACTGYRADTTEAATACGTWLFQAVVHLGWISFTFGGQDLKLYSSLAFSGLYLKEWLSVP